ncbi:MAG: hypothetical protein WCW66_01900 [Patescibacteria group bacterium]|jgi:hypothetical protein
MKKHVTYIFVLLLISVAIAGLPNFVSGQFPVWKDSIAVACSVKHIGENGELGLGDNFYINFDNVNIPYCWDKNVYPLNQIYMYAFSSFSSIDPAMTVTLVYILIYLLIVTAVYLVAWELYNKHHLAFLSAILAGTSLALLRILTISPQQLFGFLLILFIVWNLLQYKKTNQKKYLLLILITVLNLALIHQLSLVVVSIALVIYFISIIKKKVLIIPFLLVAFSIIAFGLYIFSSGNNPLDYILKTIYYASTIGMSNLLPAHPIWEHPAILGYFLSIFGLFGALINLFTKKSPLKVFWWSMILFCLFMTHSYLLGFYFVGYRFLFFLFLPLSLLAPIFFVKISGAFGKSARYPIAIIIILSILASGIHGVNFLLDNYNGLSKPVLPTKEYREAITWLNDHSNKTDTVLTTIRNDQKYGTFLPYLYNGNVMIFPTFYFHKPMEFEFRGDENTYSYSGQSANPTTVIGKLIKPYVINTEDDEKEFISSYEDQRQVLYEMFKMTYYPKDIESQEYLDKYDIRFVIIWRGKPESQIYANTSEFKKVYQTESIAIYQYTKLN